MGCCGTTRGQCSFPPQRNARPSTQAGWESGRATKSMARHSTEQSVLGPGTRVTGRVSGDGGVRIEGALRGDVQVTGEAEVAPGASIEGNVQAESLDVQGSLVGDVNVRGAVAIHSGALVRGELKGNEISIEPGARVSVKLDTEIELDFGSSKRR